MNWKYCAERRNIMIPDYHTIEKLAIQHRQQLIQEAEHENMLAMIDSPQRASRAVPRLAGKLGIFLLVMGTKLKQFEHHSEVVTAPGKSR
jgi:hypothetical protein